MVVESGPAWFNKLKKKSAGLVWEEVPDTDFVDEVYVKALSFREKVQASFRQDKAASDSGASDSEELQASVGDGLFEGVAVSAK